LALRQTRQYSGLRYTVDVLLQFSPTLLARQVTQNESHVLQKLQRFVNVAEMYHRNFPRTTAPGTIRAILSDEASTNDIRRSRWNLRITLVM
jgi:hypothetical protein